MKARRYRPVANKPLENLDYTAERPFLSWRAQHLTASIGGWLQLDPPCLELATLAYDELSERNDHLNAGMKFAGAALEPIPWLRAARRCALDAFSPSVSNVSGKGPRGHVYVVLRGGYTEANGWYGAYVGSTRKSPERRFVEHRKGVRAARGLPAHGIELLYSVFSWINPVPGRKDDLGEYETRLHEALAPVVPKVTGDVAF